MILISVGSTLFPFQRMVTLAERIAHVRPEHETMIFQYGNTPPHFVDPHVSSYPFIPHKRLMRYMKESRVIITHGGPATIYQALSFGKVPWVLPRQKRYGEHLNDHQVDFARFLARHRLIRIITPATPIRSICATDKGIHPVNKHNAALVRHLDSLLTQR